MPKLTDQMRREAVAGYLRGTATQEEFCAAFEVKTGHHLSPRTLRSWVVRFGSGGTVARHARALLTDALDQVRALEARLLAALELIDAEVAASVPERHKGAGQEDLLTAAGSAGPVESAEVAVATSWVAAAEQPHGIKEDVTTERPATAKFTWEWD